MDRFSRVLIVAGILCFVFAFVLSGLYPYMITDAKTPEASIAELAAVVPPVFKSLKDADPSGFVAAFPAAAGALSPLELLTETPDEAAVQAGEAAWRAVYAEALQRGRDNYIADGCWHCHSQYVRPVANEEQRFGPVLPAANDNNALQRPVLWGTRRVGPDLTHEGGLRSNDWHLAHFANPQGTSPDSVMPAYPWFLRTGFQVRRTIAPEVAEREGLDPATSYPVPGLYATQAEAQAALERVKAALPSSLAAEQSRLLVAPGTSFNGRGFSLVAYLQWLGTWTPPAARAAATGGEP